MLASRYSGALPHATSPMMKLVSRGDTTVVDAYLSPILRRYVDQVAAWMRDRLAWSDHITIELTDGQVVEGMLGGTSEVPHSVGAIDVRVRGVEMAVPCERIASIEVDLPPLDRSDELGRE